MPGRVRAGVFKGERRRGKFTAIAPELVAASVSRFLQAARDNSHAPTIYSDARARARALPLGQALRTASANGELQPSRPASRFRG